MAASVIKVGMDVGDVKSAGLELIKLLQGQVDSTLQLAEAQQKYNKSGEQVATILKGMTDAGERYTVTLKETAKGYELVNAQVNNSKNALAGMMAQQKQAADAARALAKEAADAAKAEAQALEQKATAQKKFFDAMSNFGGKTSGSMIEGMSVAGRQAAAGTGAGAPLPPGPPGPTGLFTGGSGASDEVAKVNKASERLFITWQGIVRLIEAQVIKRAINEIGNALSQAVTDASKFSVAIAEIRTISQDQPLSVAKWREELTKLSSAYGVSQLDVAAGAYEALSNQTAKSTEVFKFLDTALRFGAATVSSTKDSVNLLSGALNSFRLPVEDAERVAGVLFKTIELGRVKAKDLADTFGRVGALAGEVGIKIEEVGAAIATISVKGVTPAETLTLINSVILKLLRPTAEMKKLFDEWGVSSGQAAIGAFGFGGVLQKLSVEAERGSGRISDLETNIRALRGTMSLTGKGFQEFDANLEKIKRGSGGEYKFAQQEVIQSPGKQLEIAGTQVKNLFTEDFGVKVVNFLNDINRALESSKGAADGFVVAIRAIITAMTVALAIAIAYKVSLIAYSAYTTIAGVASLGFDVIVQKLTVDIIALGVALKTAVPLLAAFAAGFALGELLQYQGKSVNELREQILKEQETAKKRNPSVARDQAADRDVTNEVKAELEKRYQFLLQYSTKVVASANSLKQRTVDNYKDATDAVKLSSKAYFDSITENITELKKVVSEADSLIKASLKRSEDYGRKSTEVIFDTRLKYANEGQLVGGGQIPLQVANDQKSEVLEKRIAVLLAEARKKALSPDKETFEESKKLYDDVQKLQAQLFDVKASNQKRVFDAKAAAGQVQPTLTTFDMSTGTFKKQFEFVVQTVEYEKQLNDLAKERLRTEEQFRIAQEFRAAEAEIQIAKEKERLRILQQAFIAIEKIDVFDKNGNLKDRYKKDPKLATREFDEQASKIRTTAGDEAFGTQFQVFADLQKQRLALVQQVEQSIRAEQAKTAQDQILKNKDAALKSVDESGALLSKSREQTSQALSSLQVNLEVIRQKVLKKNQESYSLFGQDIRVRAPDENSPRAQAAEAARQEALALVDKVDLARRALTGDSDARQSIAKEVRTLAEEQFKISEAARKASNEAGKLAKADPTPENMARWRELYAQAVEAKAKFDETVKLTPETYLKQKIAELDSLVRKYTEIKTGQSTKGVSLKDDETGETIESRLNRLKQDSGQIDNGAALREAGIKGLQDASTTAKDFAASMKDLPGFTEFFSRTLAEKAPVIIDTFSQLIGKAREYAQSLREINSALERQGALIPQTRGNRDQEAPGNLFGGEPRYMSFGGFVPRGSDRVPAMLSEDEYVMTGAATKRFAPLLRAMNAYPSRYMNTGGAVTNVGDINVTVNGGDTSSATVNEIATALRRGIRRGTISLNG